ncbi:hypothetical protein [Streptomyces sp. SID8352]|uniref:hypothetical protein n=1 Tax=Streptomyces sp. SID8352 TaxID=2690338 RepID=UPI001F301652|nr:hypothetical protein [Streptomyces sp. SID8352]
MDVESSPSTARHSTAGSRTARRIAVALIAAMTPSGQVLAQRQIDGKSNEISAFAPLLDGSRHRGRPPHPARSRRLTCTDAEPTTWPW